MFLPERYEFSCPVKINSGNRALEHLPFEFDILNVRKPFVITNKGTAERGLVDTVIDAFGDSGITIGVFNGVPPVPDLTLIRELFTIYRDRGFDAIIALGGGSVTDTAKVLNIAVSGEPEDLERCVGDNMIKKPLKPFIMIPTLAGSGYETSRYAFFEGKTYASHFLMPGLVIIDPRMTIAEDAITTAAAAHIALTHSVEAYVSHEKNPLTDSYAYAAIRFVMENMVNVIRNPRDRNGCLALANAYCFAGCTFSNTSSGIAYTLGKAIGAACNISPGVCMGILLPHVIEMQRSRSGHHISELLLPLAGFDMYAETAENMRAQKAIDILYNYQKNLFEVSSGVIARTLEGAKVPKEILQDIVKKTVDYDSGNVGMDDCLKILERAWEGR
jgi:alcohol dehydrogenase